MIPTRAGTALTVWFLLRPPFSTPPPNRRLELVANAKLHLYTLFQYKLIDRALVRCWAPGFCDVVPRGQTADAMALAPTYRRRIGSRSAAVLGKGPRRQRGGRGCLRLTHGARKGQCAHNSTIHGRRRSSHAQDARRSMNQRAALMRNAAGAWLDCTVADKRYEGWSRHGRWLTQFPCTGLFPCFPPFFLLLSLSLSPSLSPLSIYIYIYIYIHVYMYI